MAMRSLCLCFGVTSSFVAVSASCSGESMMCDVEDEKDCDSFFDCKWTAASPSPQPPPAGSSPSGSSSSSGSSGSCSSSDGHESILCDGKDEKDCDPFFDCQWTTGSPSPLPRPSPSPPPKPSGKCGPDMFCEGHVKEDCMFFSSCTWTEDTGSGSSSGSSGAGSVSAAPAAPSNFCESKTWSGDYCSGRALVTCDALGGLQSQVSCDNSCAEQSGKGDAICEGSSSYKSPDPTPRDFCHMRMRGTYCNGRVLVTCGFGDEPESEKDCGDKCSSGLIDGNAECGSPDFCKMNGLFCDKHILVECDGFKIKRRTNCLEGSSGSCMSSRWSSSVASCGDPDFCKGKMEGLYCDGPRRIITCSFPSDIDSIAVCPSSMPCKESARATGEAMCGDPDVCSSQLDGKYCDGNTLVTCRSFRRQSVFNCALRSTTCQTGAGIGNADCGNVDFCQSKLSGDYCETEKLLVSCDNFKVARRAICPDALKCSANSFQKASCGQVDACFAKLSGWHCFETGRMRFQCSAGLSTPLQVEYCGAFACSEKFPGQATCGDADFCIAKLPGTYCDGQYVVTCKDFEVQARERCMDELCSESLARSEATCGTIDFCHMKHDGTYCDGNFVKACVNGELISKQFCHKAACTSGVGTMTSGSSIGGTAMCGDASFCNSKTKAGTYCDGDYVVTCRTAEVGRLEPIATGAIPQYDYCGLLGCSELPESTNAAIAFTQTASAVCGTDTFCNLKASGVYCESASLLSECEDGLKKSSVICPAASCKSEAGLGAWCSRVMHEGQLYSSPCDLETANAVICRDGVSYSCEAGKLTKTEVCSAGCSSSSGTCCELDVGGSTWCTTSSGSNGTRVRSSVLGPQVCADDASFKDANGNTCNFFAGKGCTSVTETLSAADVELLLLRCPKACGTCGSGSVFALTDSSRRRRPSETRGGGTGGNGVGRGDGASGATAYGLIWAMPLTLSFSV